jgi:hypothetical protein
LWTAQAGSHVRQIRGCRSWERDRWLVEDESHRGSQRGRRSCDRGHATVGRDRRETEPGGVGRTASIPPERGAGLSLVERGLVASGIEVRGERGGDPTATQTRSDPLAGAVLRATSVTTMTGEASPWAPSTCFVSPTTPIQRGVVPTLSEPSTRDGDAIESIRSVINSLIGKRKTRSLGHRDRRSGSDRPRSSRRVGDA